MDKAGADRLTGQRMRDGPGTDSARGCRHREHGGGVHQYVAAAGAAAAGPCRVAVLMFTPAAELRGQSRVYDLLSNRALSKDLIMAKQIVMNATGDTRHEFDPADAAALAEASTRFKELTGAGFTAAVRRGAGASQLVRHFDPTADETVFFPAARRLVRLDIIHPCREQAPSPALSWDSAGVLIKGTDDGRDSHVRLDWSSPGTAAC